MIINISILLLMVVAFAALLASFSVAERLYQSTSIWAEVLALIGMVACYALELFGAMLAFLLIAVAQIALQLMKGAWKARGVGFLLGLIAAFTLMTLLLWRKAVKNPVGYSSPGSVYL